MQPPGADDTIFIEISPKQVVVGGLIWSPLTDLKNLRTEAKKVARKEKCRYFVVHKAQDGKNAQCGGLAGLLGNKRYYSVALMLIEKLGDNWLGVFALNGGKYLMVGVDGGQIVPGCDAIFVDETEVIERFNNYRSLFNWQTVYSPIQLNLGGEEINLELYLRTISPNKNYELEDLLHLDKQSRQVMVWGTISLGAIIVIWIGWRIFNDHLEDLRMEQMRILAESQKRQQTLNVEDVWRVQPPAGELLHNCVQIISDYPITIAGWQATSITCDHKTALAIYQRGPQGTINNLLAMVPDRYREHLTILNIGGVAQITQPVKITGNRTSEKIQHLATIVNYMSAKLHTGLFNGKIEDIYAMGNTTDKKAKFELAMQSLPTIIFQDINLDGVVIDTVGISLTADAQLTWKVYGVVYGE